MQEHMEQCFFSRHLELICAAICGLLIAAAWFVDKSSSHSAAVALYLTAFGIGGWAKAKEGILTTWHEQKLNVELLMILAAIGSCLIGYWMEGAILIFIFAVSGALETYTMEKSKQEIASLMAIQPEEAWRLTEKGDVERVRIDDLAVGDRLLVKPGERMPADGELVDGRTAIDESAITGESVPVEKQPGSEVFAGTVNLNGVVQMKMTKPGSDSLFSKIIQLVQSAQSEKSPAQQFIERFEDAYVKCILFAVALMMFLPHFTLGWDWRTTLYRAMILLVVASPCAVVASIMPATLAAISNGARRGVLFKGGVHLEHIGSVRALAFDKTGTLTAGLPTVTDLLLAPEADEKRVLAFLLTAESATSHPLARAITSYAQECGAQTLPYERIEDVAGSGIDARIDGTSIRIGKPAFVGEEEAADFAGGALDRLAAEGKTVVFLSSSDVILAAIALQDRVRPEAQRAIAELQAMGVTPIMLTGDNERTARAIASEAGIEQFIAECLPEEKMAHMKALLARYEAVGMVGDGINDAPALAQATVGIAMGQGSDVALETADIILMNNNLSNIAYANRLAKKMQRVVKQNIAFSLSVMALLIASNFLQLVDLPLGVIGHEGSTILVILNGLRLLSPRV